MYVNSIVGLVLFNLILVYGQIQPEPLQLECLGCICEAISSEGCRADAKCNGDTCGMFRITWAYWADGGKHTIPGDSPESQNAYLNCATDINCATLTVQGYMAKYAKDCNNDGRIDCDDYALIHKLGGYGCQNNVDPVYSSRYQTCKKQVFGKISA